MLEEEKDLLVGCRAGKEESFRILIRMYQGRIFNTVLRLVGPEEAGDVTQEVFLRIWRNIKNFRAEASLSTWIYRIALNTSRDHRRRAKRRVRHVPYEDVEQLADDNPAIETKIQKDELQKEIQGAITAMAPPLREVLVLRELQGLSYQDIARIVKIPLGTVRSRLARGRQEFKRVCEERGVGLD